MIGEAGFFSSQLKVGIKKERPPEIRMKFDY